MTYSEKLKDPRWQRKRLEILERDEWTCRDCLETSKPLHVHHCLYQSGKEPWEYDNNVLRTLCEDCHPERGAIEHDVKLEFQRLLAMLTTEQLGALMTQILEAKNADQLENGLCILSQEELDWQSDIRWFLEAQFCNKTMRDSYEDIMEKKFDWERK